MLINLPSPVAIGKTINKRIVDTSKFLAIRKFPVVGEKAHKIEYWEEYGPDGMTHVHALEGEVSMIPLDKRVKKEFEPGYFKEGISLTEKDLLMVQKIGEPAEQQAKFKELVAQAIDKLKTRMAVRKEWALWQAILTGQVTVTDTEKGISYTATYGQDSGNLDNVVTAAWTSTANARPIKDMLNIQKTFFEDKGYELGEVIMNLGTAHNMVLCDEFKKYYRGTLIKEIVLNPLAMVKYFDIVLPDVALTIYNKGYIAEGGSSITKFVPDNKVVFLSKRDNSEIMDFVEVPSLHKNPNGNPEPGEFVYPINKLGEASPHYDLVGGFYGFPRMRRPEEIVTMDTSKT